MAEIQPNLFDIIFGFTLAGAVLYGCIRGNGRETLHSVLFGLSLVGMWLFMRGGEPAVEAADVARTLVGISFYTLAMYAFSFGLTGILSPFMLDNAGVGIRSRFWGGAQAIGKLALAVVGVNLWYAAQSPLPVAERLTLLPPLFSDSVIIRLSDRFTHDVQATLASMDLMQPPLEVAREVEPSPETVPPIAVEPESSAATPDGLLPDEQTAQPNL